MMKVCVMWWCNHQKMSQRSSPLFNAINQNTLELGHDVDVNHANDDSVRPLHILSILKRFDVVEIMLSHPQVDVNHHKSLLFYSSLQAKAAKAKQPTWSKKHETTSLMRSKQKTTSKLHDNDAPQTSKHKKRRIGGHRPRLVEEPGVDKQSFARWYNWWIDSQPAKNQPKIEKKGEMSPNNSNTLTLFQHHSTAHHALRPSFSPTLIFFLQTSLLWLGSELASTETENATMTVQKYSFVNFPGRYPVMLVWQPRFRCINIVSSHFLSLQPTPIRI